MLTFMKYTACGFVALALIGAGWAWVTMLIAEQKEFNKLEEEGRD